MASSTLSGTKERKALSTNGLIIIKSASAFALFALLGIVTPQSVVARDGAASGSDDSEVKAISKTSKKTKFKANKLELHMLEIVNRDRAQFGAPPVKLDPKLSQLARDFAQDMQKRDFFAHTNPDGLSAQQRARKAGIVPGVYENLGWQQGPESAEQLVDALEKSFMDEPDGQPNHRFILLNPSHCCVGIGIQKTGDQVHLVQEFTDSEP